LVERLFCTPLGYPHHVIRTSMANGRRATLEEAMAAFREAFDRVPDNTVDKSAGQQRYQPIVG